MPNNAMTPHVSGTTLSAQARYAAGTREILEDFFADKPIRDEYLIVAGGGVGRHRQGVLHRGQWRQPRQQRQVAQLIGYSTRSLPSQRRNPARLP